MTLPPKPSELSEQGYGVGINEQARKLLKDKGVILGASLFPTLREEKRLGYDLYLERLGGGAIILQFKLSTFAKVNRSNSPTFPKSRIGHHRFKIPFGDHQVALLKKIEKDAPDCFVRYVAPMFSSLQEYQARYRNGSLLRDSYSFPPLPIKPDQSGKKADNYVVWLENPIKDILSTICPDKQDDSPSQEVRDALFRIWGSPQKDYPHAIWPWQRFCTPEGEVLEGENFEEDLLDYCHYLTMRASIQDSKTGSGLPHHSGSNDGHELSTVLAGLLPDEEARNIRASVEEEYKAWEDRPELLEAEISVRLGRRLGLDVMIPFRRVKAAT